jgi:hypothetical protein
MDGRNTEKYSSTSRGDDRIDADRTLLYKSKIPLHRLPTTPIANDLTNTPIANDLTTRDHPFHDSRSRDAPIDAARWRLEKKKRFRERVGHPSSVRSNTRDASRVFKRTRRSMRRVAHSSIAFNLVRVGWTDVPA